MRIEAKYHDTMKERLNRLLQEIYQENENISPEEKAELQQKNRLNAQKLIDSYEKKYGNLEKIPVESKVSQFLEYSRDALWLASHAELNIIAESGRSLTGKIILEGNWTWISQELNEKMKIIMNKLFMAADDIIMCAVPDLYRIEFLYKLYDTKL